MECLREFPHPSTTVTIDFSFSTVTHWGAQKGREGKGLRMDLSSTHQTSTRLRDPHQTGNVRALSPLADRYVVELIASCSGTDPCHMWTTEILPRYETDGPRGRTTRRTGRDTVRLQVLAHRTGFGVKRSGTDTVGFVLCLNGHLRERLRF